MTDKILTLLGFAAKSGRLGYGFDSSLTAIKKGKSCLILSAEDVSDKSRKEISFFANRENVEALIIKGVDIQALSNAVGRRCGIVSVNDSGFADALKAHL